MLLAAVICLLALASTLALRAQEPDETPPPAKPSRGAVKLQFLPPPMDGTLSLGIYDAKGKLVRTLHRAAKEEAFTAAPDGLATSWDGRDDNGNPAPAGRYSARGFCVGKAVQSRRVDFSPGRPAAEASPPPGASAQGSPAPASSPAAAAASASPSPDAGSSPAADIAGAAVASPSPGPAAPEASPTPATSADAAGYSAAPVTLDAVRGQLKTPDGKPFAPEEKIKLKLRPNPLMQARTASAEVAVGFDEKGSFVKTVDGLELKRVSETPRLKWAAAMRGAEPGSLIIFQSDGATVEEIAVSRLGNMMAFDCGAFDYEPAK